MISPTTDDKVNVSAKGTDHATCVHHKCDHSDEHHKNRHVCCGLKRSAAFDQIVSTSGTDADFRQVNRLATQDFALRNQKLGIVPQGHLLVFPESPALCRD